jgi:excinuclease ABC subunit C
MPQYPETLTGRDRRGLFVADGRFSNLDPGAHPSIVTAMSADHPEQNETPIAEGQNPEKESKTGPEVIASYLKLLPSSPGVYRMLNAAGEVIYVGKARSLKSRVSNYARLNGHTNRIARMITATASMEFVSVRTEAEALLLEANLIKRFRPRFNVLMRDDKSFPYIVITRDHGSPQVTKHRGARSRKGDYFGPFASAGAVNRTITMLQRAFLLRTCNDSVFDSRTRPCLLYQIKRCAGPCTNEIPADEYSRLVNEAVRFLRGESQNVREMYQSMMQKASDDLDFETAAKFRNRLWALAHVTADQSINPDGVEEADVFAAYQEGGMTCIQVFFFRTGQNWGNRAYYPKADRSLSVEDVLDSFVAQFYDDKPIPRMILLSHDVPSRTILAQALTSKAERKVDVRVPERGTKSGLVDHALANAREALGRKLAESSSQARLLSGVAERFGLPKIPRRIEVFDNSHISGTNAVGAMIVAGPEGFVKGQYRKFNIKSPDTAPGDDYAMMREVFERRFRRIADAAPSATADDDPDDDDNGTALDDSEFPSVPDLVLVDGGAGQLAVAEKVFSDLGITGIQLVGVAKGPDRDAGREHFHIPGRAQSLMLETRDPVLYFVQRLRDEAHRFAIGAHRSKRSASLTANPLDEIDGIGPTRKRALLKHFGSAKAVSRAGIEDLKAVSGISADMAQKVYDFFHDRSG